MQQDKFEQAAIFMKNTDTESANILPPSTPKGQEAKPLSYQYHQHQDHNPKQLKVKVDMAQQNTGRICTKCPNH